MVEANPGGPRTGYITIVGPPFTVSQAGTGGSSSLAITSQTWTPVYVNGHIDHYSALVTGTASGPIGSSLGASVTNINSQSPSIVTDSWHNGLLPIRESGDPATTNWTVTDYYVVPGDTLTISLLDGVTHLPTYVYAHP